MGRKIASKLKAVLEFHHSIALHGFTAYAVQASSIHIHLNLVHQVYVRLAGQFAASHFIKRHVLVFAGSLVKDGHILKVRRSTTPEAKLAEIQDALGITPHPVCSIKSVWLREQPPEKYPPSKSGG